MPIVPGPGYVPAGDDDPTFDGGGGGGDDRSMEARLSEVEKAIARIDATLPNLATKAELSQGFADTIKWIIGTGAAGIAVFITVMTFVLNNAVPKAASPAAAPTAPIIIYAQPPAPSLSPSPPAPR